MKNCQIAKLKNGLTLIYVKNKKKHLKDARLYIKFGGNNKSVYTDKEIKIKDGTAHFIEHLLIEQSKYGNVSDVFHENQTYSNGYTSMNSTYFVITAKYDFEGELVKLINYVNDPAFTKKSIDIIKPAIIQEKMANMDRPYYDYFYKPLECLIKEAKDPNVLGSLEDIKNMDYNYIKTIYNIFYQPQNQILAITGNINFSKIKKLVEETYNKISKPVIDFKLPNITRNQEVVTEFLELQNKVTEFCAKVSFKFDLSHLSPEERLKYDHYSYIHFKYLTDRSSKLYEELVSENICQDIIRSGKLDYNSTIIISVDTRTKDAEEFKKRLINELKNSKITPKQLETFKKESIMTTILNEDSQTRELDDILDNILSYDYYSPTTEEFIKNLNYKEYENIISKLSFDHHALITLEPNK